MRYIFTILSFFILLPLAAQQPALNENELPSAELLEFLAEFNMLTENGEKDYDLIQHHALQDLKKQSRQDNNNER